MAVEVATYIEELNPAWPDDNDEIPEGDDHIRTIKGTLQTQFPNLGIAVAVNPTAAELNFMVGVTLGVQFQFDALSVRVDGNDTELADHETRIGVLETNDGVQDTRLTDLEAADVVHDSRLDATEAATLLNTNARIDHETRISTLEAVGVEVPATSRMLFRQAAVPTGWTLVADNDDKVIINRSGVGGGAGGSWIIAGITVDGHVLTTPEMPAHTHTGPSHTHGAGSYTSQLGESAGSITRGTRFVNSLNNVPVAVLGTSGAAGTGATGSTGSGSAHTHGVTSSGTWRPSYVDVVTGAKD